MKCFMINQLTIPGTQKTERGTLSSSLHHDVANVTYILHYCHAYDLHILRIFKEA
jgi:hypothetical protein